VIECQWTLIGSRQAAADQIHSDYACVNHLKDRSAVPRSDGFKEFGQGRYGFTLEMGDHVLGQLVEVHGRRLLGRAQ
jgi:hypothetical protein